MGGIEGGPWATGIGSLPFAGEDAFDRAREVEARFERELPFLFELPGSHVDSALIRRPLAAALEPGGMTEARLRVSCDEARTSISLPVEWPPFLDVVLRSAAPRIKVQVAGPNALGNYVLDQSGKPLADTPSGRALALEAVEKTVGAFCTMAKQHGFAGAVIAFLDEPGLGRNVGELGKAVELARKAGAWLVGVHDCSPDFRNAIAAKPDVLSFDFASFGAHVGDTGDPIAEFVRGGGSLAWGAISTGPTARRFDPSVTAGAIRTAALRLMGSKAGADALLARSLVTPACGTALLEPSHATSLHLRAIQVAELLRLGR